MGGRGVKGGACSQKKLIQHYSGGKPLDFLYQSMITQGGCPTYVSRPLIAVQDVIVQPKNSVRPENKTSDDPQVFNI